MAWATISLIYFSCNKTFTLNKSPNKISYGFLVIPQIFNRSLKWCSLIASVFISLMSLNYFFNFETSYFLPTKISWFLYSTGRSDVWVKIESMALVNLTGYNASNGVFISSSQGNQIYFTFSHIYLKTLESSMIKYMISKSISSIPNNSLALFNSSNLVLLF